ncbi:MAG: TrkA family potassium uptake protein [Lachnospiraceae bacterium]|nr:TrkA family potassium uptake protein [Lachnospiraceae bacterium]MDE6233853.1 TrkA family potassium uptake protein [Lachnospiraceae bacterium]MDE6252882.1 TrkA family potassium uptake protein [Lachnospiraceae bacterium]
MGKKSYAVIGLGRFGAAIAEELSRAGAEVLAVDEDEERVHELASIVTCAVKADVCDAESMESLGLSNMDGVVVAITENLDASIMGTILAKEAGVDYILAKARDAIHARILEKVGADKVIVPEKESGIRIARSMMSGKFLDFIELSNRIRMIEIPVKEEWIGKTLIQLNLRKTKKINVIAVRNVDDEIIVNFEPERPIKAGMSMLVTVDRNDIAKLVN